MDVTMVIEFEAQQPTLTIITVSITVLTFVGAFPAVKQPWLAAVDDFAHLCAVCGINLVDWGADKVDIEQGGQCSHGHANHHGLKDGLQLLALLLLLPRH